MERACQKRRTTLPYRRLSRKWQRNQTVFRWLLYIQDCLYITMPPFCTKMTHQPGGLLYDVNLIRAICRDISSEADPEKAEDLVALLRASMREDREQFKARIRSLTKQYSHLLRC
jgi:hypothetical protein